MGWYPLVVPDEAKWMTVQQAMYRYRISRSVAEIVARNLQARAKISKRIIRYDRRKMDDFFNMLAEQYGEI